MSKIRVALGLSGGVDSAVSAYLLKKSGYDVHCVYLNCFDHDIPGCRGDNDRKDALAVAIHLGLPFRVLDFRKEYQAAVIDYFKKEYLSGRTPNPDVVCNRDIKFGLFLDWSKKHHFDYIATGHYAKITSAETMDDREIEDSGGRWKIEDRKAEADRSTLYPLSSTTTLHRLSSTVNLIRPKDLHKDQTYFLWAVPGEKFKRVLFPLGNLLKTEVREIALKIGLPVANKKDSTGICFVGEVRVEDFLKRLGVKEKRGEVVMRTTIDNSEIEDSGGRWKIEDRKNGTDRSTLDPLSSTTIFHHPSSIVHYKVVGSHRGVWFYTIGQRHGFSTDLRSSKKPMTNDEFRMTNGNFNIQHSTFNIQPFTSDRPPLYVIEKDIKNNRLIVGFGAETYRSQFTVSDINWLVSKKARPFWKRPGLNKFTCLVRIRHGGELIPCSVISSQSSVVSSKSAGCQSAGLEPKNRKPVNQNLTTDNRKPITIFLSSPQRGIAPGQSAVFYSEDGEVLGGGIISDY